MVVLCITARTFIYQIWEYWYWKFSSLVQNYIFSLSYFFFEYPCIIYYFFWMFYLYNLCICFYFIYIFTEETITKKTKKQQQQKKRLCIIKHIALFVWVAQHSISGLTGIRLRQNLPVCLEMVFIFDDFYPWET